MLRWSALEEGILLQRVNRFLALVEKDGSQQWAFVANTGRLAELMLPGAKVFLHPVSRPQGRTHLDLKLVEHAGILVSVDTRAPGDLLHLALLAGSLAEFRGHQSTRREVTFGDSHLDFALAGPERPCLIEVKSVTLVKNGRALSPDAPTERGARHLATLQRAVAEGHRAAVVFLIQRADALSFSPHDETDPNFGKVLREAVASGVEAYAYRCEVSFEGIEIANRAPLAL